MNNLSSTKKQTQMNLSKIMVDSWTTRKTSDDATRADATNKLGDEYIAKVLTETAKQAGITL